jgi:hypothetical protein
MTDEVAKLACRAAPICSMSGNTKSASKPNGLRDESDAIASAATPAFHDPELAGVVHHARRRSQPALRRG